jgi:ATP phosphoribosyltransferase
MNGNGRMLRVALPSKGTLAAPASEVLADAGYRQRHDTRDLTVIDTANEVEFFFLRPGTSPSTWAPGTGPRDHRPGSGAGL